MTKIQYGDRLLVVQHSEKDMNDKDTMGIDI